MSSFSEPGTVARIIEAERERVNAVVVDCMADPALQAARECVSIPVVGPSQTAMHLAAMLLPEMTKSARAGDYFLDQADDIANVLNAAGL